MNRTINRQSRGASPLSALGLVPLALLVGCQSLGQGITNTFQESFDYVSNMVGGQKTLTAGFIGDFCGEVDGVPARIELEQSGPVLGGRALVGNSEYSIIGRTQDSLAQGRLVSIRSAASIPFEARVDGSRLVLVLPSTTAENDLRAIPFERLGADGVPLVASETSPASAGPRTFEFPGASAPESEPPDELAAPVAGASRSAGLPGIWYATDGSERVIEITDDGTLRLDAETECREHRWTTEEDVLLVEASAGGFEPWARYSVGGSHLLLVYPNGESEVWTNE